MSEFTVLEHTRSGENYIYSKSGFNSGYYKIWIPQGTTMWRTGITTYLDNDPASAALKMGSAPEQEGTPVNDTRKTLQRLDKGETLSFYAPPFAQTLTISTSQLDDYFVTTEGKWLYIKIKLPKGGAIRFDSIITVRESQSIEQLPDDARMIKYLEKSNLITPLFEFSSTRNDTEFVQKAISTGVVDGLIRMMLEIEKTKQ